MDYWHGVHCSSEKPAAAESESGDKEPKVALVKPMDATIGAQNATHFTVQPNTPDLILNVAQELGVTRYGESYAASHLCNVVKHFGYKARLHRSASLRTLVDLIDQGRPPIVCVDINLTTFLPADDLNGQHTHFVVIEGYFGSDDSNEGTEPALPKFLLVKQSGARAPIPTVWPVETFMASWCGAGWDGRYRKRAMPREVANRISICRAPNSQTEESQVDKGAGARLDSERAPMSEAEAERIWAEGVEMGVLEEAAAANEAEAGGGRVRLAEGHMLYHHEELRQTLVEITQ